MGLRLASLAAVLALVPALGCSSGATSTTPPGRPSVPGTVFTIVFENENSETILTPALPFFNTFAAANGSATRYVSRTHPSLPNYIELTSGSNNGINDDNDPTYNLKIFGSENLPDQLDAAGIKWRAYMESMGEPCKSDSTALYSAHHNPFVYYASMVDDPARCNEHVVDYEQHFAADLAANTYRYMWITPNMCDDMHSCDDAVADAWLQRTIATIQRSAGYQNGGAIFVLFDEGSFRLFGSGANLATIISSPNLIAHPFQTSTPFDHRSYVATVEDIFGLPRLPTTRGVTSMDEFFTSR